jgi:hypothetical protein
VRCANVKCRNEVPRKVRGGGKVKRFCSQRCQETTWAREQYQRRREDLLRRKREQWATDAVYREREKARHRLNAKVRRRRARATRQAVAARVMDPHTVQGDVGDQTGTVGLTQWARDRGYDPVTRTYA